MRVPVDKTVEKTDRIVAASYSLVARARASVVKDLDSVGKAHRALREAQASLRRLERALSANHALFGLRADDNRRAEKGDAAYRRFIERLRADADSHPDSSKV